MILIINIYAKYGLHMYNMYIYKIISIDKKSFYVKLIFKFSLFL